MLRKSSPVFSFQVFSLLRYLGLLLTSVFLARWYPGSELLDHYEKLLLLGTSTTFFWLSGLLDGFLVLFQKSDQDGRSGLARSVPGMVGAFAAVGAVLAGLGGTFLLSDPLPGGLLIAFCLFLFLDNFSFPLVYFLLARARSRSMMGLALLAYGGYALVLLVGLYLGYTLEACFVGLAALALAKSVWMLGLVNFRPVLGAWRPLWQIGGPLAGAALLSHSATYVDAYLVEQFFSDQFVSFRYGAKELPLALLLANSMSVAISGTIARRNRDRELAQGLSELRRSGLRLMHLLFPVSAVLLLASDPVFLNVLGPDFADAVPVFDLYLLLILPRMLFPQAVLRGLELTRWLTFSALIELLLNVGLSLLFMQWWGLPGIAGATVVAYFMDKLFLMAVCHRKLAVKPAAYTSLGWWGIYSIGLLALWVVKWLWA